MIDQQTKQRVQANMLRRRLASKHPQSGAVLRIAGLLSDVELIERWQDHEQENSEHQALMAMARQKQAAEKEESPFENLVRKAVNS